MKTFLFYLLLLAFLYWLYTKKVKQNRVKFIQNYPFPKTIFEKVKERYPHLSDKDIQLVERGLRDYFLIALYSKGEMVTMPSKVVDEAWHNFILFTKLYTNFCDKALGRFLHHIPPAAMESKSIEERGLKRAWELSCKIADMDPGYAYKLPLLFSIDSDLKIEDGLTYSLKTMQSKSKSKLSNSSSSCGSCSSCSSCSSCGGGCGGG